MAAPLSVLALHSLPSPIKTTDLVQDVMVHGGQIIFVGPDGALSYTGPQSTSYPAGSILNGFTYARGGVVGHFGFMTNGSTGFLACPRARRVYQVYVRTAGFQGNSTACLGFEALTEPADAPGAWEYT